MTIPTPPRTQPRTWSPLPVAAGPKATPRRLQEEIAPMQASMRKGPGGYACRLGSDLGLVLCELPL
jgi:hypothetical protein